MGYFAYNGSRKQLQKETHYMKTNTIACIANKAGVSIATVSRALSGSNKVANETKQRIMQIADEMGYEGAVQKPGPVPRHPPATPSWSWFVLSVIRFFPL